MKEFSVSRGAMVVPGALVFIGIVAGACSPPIGAGQGTTEPDVHEFEPTAIPASSTPPAIYPHLESLEILVNGETRELKFSGSEYRLAGTLSPHDSLTVNALVDDDSDGEFHFGSQVSAYDLGESVEIKATAPDEMLEATFPILVEAEDGQRAEYQLAFEPSEEWGPQIVVDNPTGTTGEVTLQVRLVDLNGSDTAELVSVEQEFNFQDTGDKKIDEYISNNNLKPFEIAREEDGWFTVNFSTEWPGRFPLHLTAVDSDGHESTDRVPVEIYWAEMPWRITGVAIETGYFTGHPSLSSVPGLIDLAVGLDMNSILLAPHWVVDGEGSRSVYQCQALENTTDLCITPTDEDLIEWIGYAHSKGMQVMLAPHVICADGCQVYELSPPSWEEWFKDYSDLVVRLAELAQLTGVEHFSIGNELQSTHSQRGHWQATLDSVREVYDGEVTYMDFTYWTGGSSFPLEDQLDYLGVNFFYPGTNQGNRDPSVDEMHEFIETRINRLLLPKMQQAGRPAMATSMGRSPHDGSAYDPWSSFTEPVDYQEQVDYYEAAFRNASRYLSGMVIWSLKSQPDSEVWEKGFDIRDKPVIDMIRIWFTRRGE